MTDHPYDPIVADQLPAVERELTTFVLLATFAPAHYWGTSIRIIDHDGGEVGVARCSRRTGQITARVYSLQGGQRLRTIVAQLPR